MAEKTNKNETKKARKIFRIVGNGLLCLILVLLAVIIFSAIYTKATGKQLFKYSTYWVLSPSMEPDIPVRSYILVEKTSADKVEIGDVISFRSQDPAIKGKLNTHRVVEVIGDHEQFRTKGDNNTFEDNYPVDAGDIEAKYVCNLKLMTAFGRFFASKVGLAIVFVAVFIGVAAWFVITAIKKKSNEPTDAEKKAELDRLIAEEVERLKKAAESGNAGQSRNADQNTKSDADSQNVGSDTKE